MQCYLDGASVDDLELQNPQSDKSGARAAGSPPHWQFLALDKPPVQFRRLAPQFPRIYPKLQGVSLAIRGIKKGHGLILCRLGNPGQASLAPEIVQSTGYDRSH
jgi:hypothetical protein